MSIHIHHDDGSKWTFGNWDTISNKTTFRYIRKLHKLPIKRHSLIKGAFNPYDPEWEDYKSMRLQINMGAIMSKLPYKLLKRQNGKCEHCGHQINEETNS